MEELGIINLMRGDSFVYPIVLNEGTKFDPKYYYLGENDKLYFGLMEPNQAFEDAVLKKVFDKDSPKDEDGNTLLTIEPKDTEHLLTGKYYYMLKLRQIVDNKEVVTTIIKPTLFWLEGNNPTNKKPYWNDIDRATIILDGGEVTKHRRIILDGGEIE